MYWKKLRCGKHSNPTLAQNKCSTLTITTVGNFQDVMNFYHVIQIFLVGFLLCCKYQYLKGRLDTNYIIQTHDLATVVHYMPKPQEGI